MPIAARLAVHAPAPDRRRKARIPATIPTLLSTEGYYGINVTVTDVSTDGFQLNAGVHIPPESLVRLKLPGLGTVIGRIAWSRKGHLGGAFVNPMSEQRLYMISGLKRPKLRPINPEQGLTAGQERAALLG